MPQHCLGSSCLALVYFCPCTLRLCCAVCVFICISGAVAHMHQARLARCPAPPAPPAPSLLFACSCCLPSRHKLLNCNVCTRAVCVRWGHASRGVSPPSTFPSICFPSYSPPPSTVHLTLPSETCLTGFGSVYFRQSKRVGGREKEVVEEGER